MKRLGKDSAFGGGVGIFRGRKADMENRCRDPDLVAAAAIATQMSSRGKATRGLGLSFFYFCEPILQSREIQ
jgi:hypothetical protein